jgi:hypothetical protein
VDSAFHQLVPAVYAQFQTPGTLSNYAPYGSGHINATFLARTCEPDLPDYILQRINESVFKDVRGLMDNVRRVTSHLRAKLSATAGADPDRECMTLLPARDGRAYCRDAEGGYWRCYLFIPDSRSYDIVRSPVMACDGGRAFGRFQRLLADLPGAPLNDTIPRFHDLDWRLEQFRMAVHADAVERLRQVPAEVDFVRERAEAMGLIRRLGRAGELPLRVTHNDTKFNNLLFDLADHALCVVDLDTVMPGYVHYDFGDAIRTGANTGAEDERDLGLVEMDVKLFEAYAQGYMAEAGEFLTGAEMEHLAFSAKLMTYIVGLRFLTDYLAGDRYYRIASPDHNLVRARAQFKLLSSMERQFARMQQIIAELRK